MNNTAFITYYSSATQGFENSMINHVVGYFTDPLDLTPMVTVNILNDLNIDVPINAVDIAVSETVFFDAWCKSCQYEMHNCPWCTKPYAHDGSDLDNPQFDHSEVCPELQSRNSVR